MPDGLTFGEHCGILQLHVILLNLKKLCAIENINTMFMKNSGWPHSIRPLYIAHVMIGCHFIFKAADKTYVRRAHPFCNRIAYHG